MPSYSGNTVWTVEKDIVALYLSVWYKNWIVRYMLQRKCNMYTQPITIATRVTELTNEFNLRDPISGRWRKTHVGLAIRQLADQLTDQDCHVEPLTRFPIEDYAIIKALPLSTFHNSFI